MSIKPIGSKPVVFSSLGAKPNVKHFASSASRKKTLLPEPPQPPPPPLSPELENLLKQLEEHPPVYPLVPMGHGLTAHFLGSRFIKGRLMNGKSLEGGQRYDIIPWFSTLLNDALKEEDVTQEERREINALQVCLSQMLEVEAVHKKIVNYRTWEERAALFSEWMTYRLARVEVGESYTVYGGWTKHSMVYEIIRESKDSFFLRIYNTGGGVENHPQIEEDFNDQNMQVLTTHSIPAEKLLCETLWQIYFEHMWGSKPKSEGEYVVPSDVESVYNWIYALDPDLQSLSLAMAGSDEIAFRRAQRAGICGVESLWLFLKEKITRSHSPALYTRLRSTMREMDLRYYDAYLVSNDLLPQELSSEAPHFLSEKEVNENLGALELLEEFADRLSRETLRNMRKGRGESEQTKILRINYLNALKQRIGKRREECFCALKQMLHISFVDRPAISLSPTVSPKSSSSQSAKEMQEKIDPWQHLIAWPAPADLLKTLEMLLPELDRDQGNYNLDNDYGFDLLIFIFKQMPSASDSYWNAIVQSPDTAGQIMKYLVKLSNFYMYRSQQSDVVNQADWHFFYMQKILAILLRLSENDPIMKGAIVDVTGVEESAFNNTKCIFTTDVFADLQVQRTRLFLEKYENANKDKVPLFVHFNKLTYFPHQTTLKIEKNFKEDPTLKYLWDNIPSSAKAKVVKDYQNGDPSIEVPEGLILARLIVHGGISPGYYALQAHMLNMMELFHGGLGWAGRRFSHKRQKIENEEMWEKTRSSILSFNVSYILTNFEGEISNRLLTHLIGSKTSLKQREGLMQWPSSEKGILEAEEECEAVLRQSMLCSEDKGHQLFKAILYYSRNRHLLREHIEQVRLSSLLLEPGILVEQLQKNPDLFTHLATFIKRGYSAFSQQKSDLSTALFFLRLSSQIESYAKAVGLSEGDINHKQLPSLLKELRRLWNTTEDLPLQEKQKVQVVLAREGLAYCGRGCTIFTEYLPDLLKYHLFVKESLFHEEENRERNNRLKAEERQGRVSLALALVWLPLQNTSDFISALEEILKIDSDSEKVIWDFSKMPTISSADGKYVIDLMKGEVFIQGKNVLLEVPYRFAWNDTWKKMFPNSQEIHSISIEYVSQSHVRLFFCDRNNTSYIAERNVLEEGGSKLAFYRKCPDGSYLKSCDLDKLPEGIEGIVSNGSFPWYNEKDGTFTFFDASAQVTHIYKEGALIEKSTGYIALDANPEEDFLYSRLKAFDPAAQIWQDPKGGKGRIDFPNADLTLNITEKGGIEGTGSLAGFYLADNQYVRSLTGFSHYLVLEHGITGEKRVLLSYRKQEVRKDYASALFLKQESSWIEGFTGCGTYSIQRGKKQRLYSDSLKDRLYLAHCYMKQGHYDKAFVILDKQARKLTPYDPDERTLLQEFLNASSDAMLYNSCTASLLRLKVLALLCENANLGKVTPKNEKEKRRLDNLDRGYSFSRDRIIDYKNYLDQFSTIPEKMRLTAEEDALLEKVIPDYAKTKQSALGLGDKTAAIYIPEKSNCSSRKREEGVLDSFTKSVLFFNISHFLYSPADEHFFSKNLLPIESPPSTIEKQFFSLYAIARSAGGDPVLKENRLRLEIWINSYQPHDGSDAIKKFLQAVLRVPRSHVDELPEPQQLLSVLSKQDEASRIAYEKMRIALESATPAAKGPLPGIPKKKKTGYKNRAIVQSQLPFDPITPKSSIDSGTVEIPSPARFSSLFTSTTRENTDPILLVNPLVKVAPRSFYAQSFQEMQTSIESHQKEEGELFEWNIEDAHLQFIGEMLQHDIGALAGQIRHRKKHLLAIANTLPITDLELQERMLEWQSKTKAIVKISEIELLFARGDRNAYLRANPSLSSEQINALYQETREWLILATAQQKSRRAAKIIKQIEQSKDAATRKSLIQLLQQELSSTRAFEVEDYPPLLVLEHQRDLLLRKSQVEDFENLKKGKTDKISEIIMGSGKSDVLLFALAFALADGENLLFSIIPQELFSTDAPKLQRYAQLFYGQEEVCVNWKNTTLEGLEELEKSLNKIREKRGFVAVTAKELHDFYLAEQEVQRRYYVAPNQDDFSLLRAFRTVRRLVKEHGCALIDEVDSQLRCSFEVLKSLEKPKAIDPIYRKITSTFFEILTTEERITSQIYFEWSKEHPSTAKLYIKERDTSFLVEELAHALLSRQDLAQCGIHFSTGDRAAILRFLTSPPGSDRELPSGLDEVTKNAFSYAKKQLHVILPNCLGKIYEQSYGLIPGKKGKAPSLLPVPWRGARCPQKRSQFACYDEIMAFAYQSYYSKEISPLLLEEITDKLRTQACLELESAPILDKAIEQTQGYQRYAALIGEDLLKQFPHLTQLTAADIAHLAKAISSEPAKLNFFISEHVLPAIFTYPAFIRSNGHSLVKQFGQAIGVSGTVNKDRHTFHRRFDVSLDPAIVGKTLVHLNKEPAPIILKNADSQEQQLITLLETCGFVPHAIIDAGALFKDIPPKRVAEILLAFGKKQKPPITSVVYYDGNKRLILSDGCSKPELYFPSDFDDPVQRITFYDQKRTIGANIKQTPLARALMTVNKEINLQQTMQGAWRMRGLDKEQSVTLVCSEDMVNIMHSLSGSYFFELTTAAVISYVKHVEINKQLEDNCKALFQQIHVEFISTCQDIIDTLRIGYSLKHPLVQKAALELSNMMITQYDESYFEHYGKPQNLLASQDVLYEHVENMRARLAQWSEKYAILFSSAKSEEAFEERMGNCFSLFSDSISTFEMEMTALVVKATDPKSMTITPTLPSHASLSQASEIEIEQQQELRQERDNLMQVEQTAASKRATRKCDLPFEPWKSDSFASWQKEGAFRPFETSKESDETNPFVCVSTALANSKYPGDENILKFSPHLLVSLNAACSDMTKLPFYGLQKILEWVLFVQDKDDPSHMQLLLLSRKEAEHCMQALSAARNDPDIHPDTLRFNIALFSPRLHGMKYEDGFYEMGKAVIDTQLLFSSPYSSVLTYFEKLIVQAKFAMGECALYTEKEQTYLHQWLDGVGKRDAERMFKEGFLPGSLQTYHNSILEKTLHSLHEEDPFFLEDDILLPPLEPPPPPPPRLYLPKPPKLVTKPGVRITMDERRQEKEANINWLFQQWPSSLLQKQKVRAILDQQQWFYVQALVDNPQFREVLDKLASAE
ncbi:MAG TPA: DUF3638 domain-containing protein [Rhabdochlamydiaceae bacterium]|jgi:hypothetical protein